MAKILSYLLDEVDTHCEGAKINLESAKKLMILIEINVLPILLNKWQSM